MNGTEKKLQYQEFFPVSLKQGVNVLLVAVYEGVGGWQGFFGFGPEAEYTVAHSGVGYTLSVTDIHVGDTFTLDIRAENLTDFGGGNLRLPLIPRGLKRLKWAKATS